MWCSKQLRRVRRARRAAKTQQHQLLTLELEGIVALTRHAATQTLTVPIEQGAGAQGVDTLRETLRERRQALKREARQLRQDWQQSALLNHRPGHPQPGPLAPAEKPNP